MIQTKINYEKLVEELLQNVILDEGLEERVKKMIAFYHSPWCGRIGCEEFEHLQGYCLGWNDAMEYINREKQKGN